MTRRSGIAALLFLLLLVGPLGLLELDHDLLHAHAGESADHPECPVCFAAKEPLVLQLPAAPLAFAEPVRYVPAPHPAPLESADLVPGNPPRGPPSAS